MIFASFHNSCETLPSDGSRNILSYTYTYFSWSSYSIEFPIGLRTESNALSLLAFRFHKLFSFWVLNYAMEYVYAI